MRIMILFLLSSLAFANDPMENYTPSNLTSYDSLNEAFSKLSQNNKRRSECFDRAHYWSYQMHHDLNLNSVKYFVFFTKKYKREIHGEWWFHVAPGLKLQSQEYVLDPEFLTKPVS